jgi:hypothetical protein
MKLTVNNSIFDVENEHGCKRFEKNVFTVLKRNGIFGEVICRNAGIIDKFDTFVIIEIDKKVIQLTDKNIFIGKVENVKQKRNLFFEVLSNQIEDLKTQLKIN